MSICNFVGCDWNLTFDDHSLCLTTSTVDNSNLISGLYLLIIRLVELSYQVSVFPCVLAEEILLLFIKRTPN